MSVAEDIKDNRKGFYRYVASKELGISVGPLQKEKRDLNTLEIFSFS